MSTNQLAISLTAFYVDLGPGFAQLRIAGEASNDPGISVTVLVAQLDRAQFERFAGNCASGKITVYDTDRIVILVDRLGELIANGVYEVSTELMSVGYLLMPRSSANILLDQSEMLREQELVTLPTTFYPVQA